MQPPEPKWWSTQREDSSAESGWAVQVSPCSGGEQEQGQAVQRWRRMTPPPMKQTLPWGPSVPPPLGPDGWGPASTRPLSHYITTASSCVSLPLWMSGPVSLKLFWPGLFVHLGTIHFSWIKETNDIQDCRSPGENTARPHSKKQWSKEPVAGRRSKQDQLLGWQGINQALALFPKKSQAWAWSLSLNSIDRN